MKKFTFLTRILLVLLITLFSFNSFAQSLTASSASISQPVGAATTNVTITRSSFDWGGTAFSDYFWSVSNNTGISSSPTLAVTPASTAVSWTTTAITVTFNSSAVVGTYTFRVQRGSDVATATVTVTAPVIPNLWASSSDGAIISSYAVNAGSYISGPTTLFTPTFPGTTTSATYTSAIGRTDKPTQAAGHYYWIGNTSSNNGVVEIWGANGTGGSHTRLGSIDMNGGSTNALGFVRLGMGPDGTGWILAGESGGGSTLYLASFATNLLAAVTPVIVDANVALVGGAASTFQNGDICVAADGRLYALANDGSGLTQIFIGVPNGSATTLTKKWDLVDNSNDPFTGSVNGVAFSITGSLYISTATGLYYIDANTVNGPAGTVQTGLVHSQTGLHDLASNVFPSTILLPVKLISFTGTLSGSTTNLNWVTESIQNFSHFEIERSTDGVNFTSIVSKNATGDLSSRATYTHSDDMSSFGANYTFYYRLKMVDLDGKFSYSSIILIRKDGKAVTDIRIIPNPLVKGSIATVRFEAAERVTVNLNILDMSGRTVLRQQNNVEPGTNSIALNNFQSLQPGTYILQMNDGLNIQTTKFIIAK